MPDADKPSPMALALAAARAAVARGEVPIGAVIVGPGGEVLADAGDPLGGRQAWRAAAGRLRSLRDPGALSDVRPGDLLRSHPAPLLGRRRSQGRRRPTRAAHFRPVDLSSQTRALWRPQRTRSG